MSKLPTISDEDLMAYADGELGEVEARRVARAIEAEPALAARLEVFRVTGRALAPQFEGLLASDPPAAMLDVIRSAPIGRAPQSPSLLASIRGFFEGFGLGPSPWPALACIAAGLLIGAAATQLAGQGGAADSLVAVDTDGRIFAAGELARVLEMSPSVPAASGDVVATSSFQAVDDRYCRTYQALRQSGLACRNPTGAWHVVAIGDGDPGAGEHVTQPSGGSGSSAVADLANQMMKSEAALDPESEAQLIARRWEAR